MRWSKNDDSILYKTWCGLERERPKRISKRNLARAFGGYERKGPDLVCRLGYINVFQLPTEPVLFNVNTRKYLSMDNPDTVARIFAAGFRLSADFFPPAKGGILRNFPRVYLPQVARGNV